MSCWEDENVTLQAEHQAYNVCKKKKKWRRKCICESEEEQKEEEAEEESSFSDVEFACPFKHSKKVQAFNSFARDDHLSSGKEKRRETL